MSDPGVVKFLNEDLRPLAELARALKSRSHSAIVRWENVLKERVPDEGDKTTVEDGREKEGVTQIAVDEIYLLTKLLVATTDQIDDALIERFCVRPLETR